MTTPRQAARDRRVADALDELCDMAVVGTVAWSEVNLEQAQRMADRAAPLSADLPHGPERAD